MRLFLTLSTLSVGAFAWLPPALPARSRAASRSTLSRISMSEAPDEAEAAPPPAPAPPARYDLRSDAKVQSKEGAGFNQFDPVLSATTFVSRRFGLAGGLALVALLAATEGNESTRPARRTRARTRRRAARAPPADRPRRPSAQSSSRSTTRAPSRPRASW